jgi:hypothetical protein
MTSTSSCLSIEEVRFVVCHGPGAIAVLNLQKSHTVSVTTSTPAFALGVGAATNQPMHCHVQSRLEALSHRISAESEACSTLISS